MWVTNRYTARLGRTLRRKSEAAEEMAAAKKDDDETRALQAGSVHRCKSLHKSRLFFFFLFTIFIALYASPMIIRNQAPHLGRSAALSLSRPATLPSLRGFLPLNRVTTPASHFISRPNSSGPPPFPPPDHKPSEKSSSETSEGGGRKSFKEKIGQVWQTPTDYAYRFPLKTGVLVVGAVYAYKKLWEGAEVEVETQDERGAVVKARGRTIDGPWQVRVMGALPLRSLSQVWGYLNGLVLPVWFRPYGFSLYAYIFGCNLDEVPKDLKEYESLGDFFYREIKEGARPIAKAAMVSPADGRVLHLGEIVGERVEQVKGITYSLEALLGSSSDMHGEAASIPRRAEASGAVVDDANFANINDIPYSLSALIGQPSPNGTAPKESDAKPSGKVVDASHPPEEHDLAHDASVAKDLGVSALGNKTTSSTELPRLSDKSKLFFCVIYLAPGDYHRFHSPTSWVVERRRHFTGDLFSVSPYIANRMKDLFVLNERVALLGRWKHGFYSMVPVGATNVGSIRINFDEALRTNTRKLSHPPRTYAEAVYSSASKLKGQPLLAGDEMGGFRLGSTIVLVFEAPEDWTFDVKPGDKVKVGQAMGRLGGQSE